MIITIVLAISAIVLLGLLAGRHLRRRGDDYPTPANVHTILDETGEQVDATVFAAAFPERPAMSPGRHSEPPVRAPRDSSSWTGPVTDGPPRPDRGTGAGGTRPSEVREFLDYHFATRRWVDENRHGKR